MSQHAFLNQIRISFGDCDPAGIVFYPNYYRWFDATCHAWFRTAGGHEALCRRLGAIGIGLVDSGAAFRSPASDGDLLDLALDVEEWRNKTVRLRYVGRIGERVAVEGFEVRALLMRDGNRLRAGEMTPLRAIMEGSY